MCGGFGRRFLNYYLDSPAGFRNFEKQRSVLFDEYYCNKNNKLGTEPIQAFCSVWHCRQSWLRWSIFSTIWWIAFCGAYCRHGIFGFGRIGYCAADYHDCHSVCAADWCRRRAPCRYCHGGRGTMRKPNRFSASVLVCLQVFSVALLLCFRCFVIRSDPFRCQCTDAALCLGLPAHLSDWYVFCHDCAGPECLYHQSGYAKTSMATTCVGALLNLILDPILIYGFDMGVVGAAVGYGDFSSRFGVDGAGFPDEQKGFIHIRRKWFRLKKIW